MAPTSWDVFIALRDHVERNPDLITRIGTTFLFKLTNPDSTWLVDLKNARGAVSEGGAGADCVLELGERDFLDLTTGKSDPMKLVSAGKLTMSGDVQALQKLTFLHQIDPAHARAAVASARAAGQGPGITPTETATSKVSLAAIIFAELHRRFAHQPELANEVQAVLVVEVTDPGSTWTIHAAGATPSVSRGATAGATATLTLTDADLAALAGGAIGALELFERGALRIDGDASIARRLGFLAGLA